MTEERTVYLSKILITLRRSILDPQGKAVQHAITSLGVPGVEDVRMGKFVELKVKGASETEVRDVTETVCKKLLANPVMEDYKYEIEKL